MPNPWNLQRKLPHLTRVSQAPSPVVITANDLPSTPVHIHSENPEEDDEEESSRQSKEKSYEDSVDDLLSLRSVSTPEDFKALTDNHKHHNSVKIDKFSPPSSTSTPSKDEDASNNGNSNNESKSGKYSAKKRGASSSASTSKKVDSGYVGGIAATRKLDGMTFCLVMLDKCYQELQRE